jgi:hypothetical protein
MIQLYIKDCITLSKLTKPYEEKVVYPMMMC